MCKLRAEYNNSFKDVYIKYITFFSLLSFLSPFVIFISEVN